MLKKTLQYAQLSSTNAGFFWERSPLMLQKKKLIKNNTHQKMYNFLHPRRKSFESFQECHRSFSLPISLSLSLCLSHVYNNSSSVFSRLEISRDMWPRCAVWVSHVHRACKRKIATQVSTSTRIHVVVALEHLVFFYRKNNDNNNKEEQQDLFLSLVFQ